MLRMLALSLGLTCAGLSAQATTLYTVDGDAGSDALGYAVAVIGDVDGDGYDDFIIGAYGEDTNGTDSGAARVFSGQTGSPLYIFNGNSAGDRLGWAVSGAGDVDGDGYADFIVGAPFDNNVGAATVYSGQAGTVLYTFNGGGFGDYFGIAVGGAGDVDADGYDDLVVGAPFEDNNGSNSGSIEIFSGQSGLLLWTLNGDSANDNLGAAVAGAGDVNADGYDDVIAGAYLDDDNGLNCGMARVYSGLDGTTLYSFYGDSAANYFGESVAGAGDVNADGYDDVIVGAYGDDNNGLDSGSARVLSGANGATLYDFYGDAAGDKFGDAVSGAGDVDGDGYDDLLVGSKLSDANGTDAGMVRVYSGVSGATLYTEYGDSASDYFGGAVGGGGDMDGDGFDDFIVGAYLDDNTAHNAGSARVFHGKFGAIIHTFDGAAAEDQYGWSIANVGDVDGDGLDDVIIGARYSDGNGASSGNVQVISGGDKSVLYDIDGNNAGDQFGTSVSGAGDVDGDGYADFIVGAKFDDDSASNAGSATVYSGRTGAVLYAVYGDSADDYFGTSVSGAGDCNADGYDDFIVGAYLDDNNGHNSGMARLFSGRTGAVIRSHNGDNVSDAFGWAVAGVGDANNDGYDDVAVGSPSDDDNGSEAGRVRLYSGQTGAVIHTLDGAAAGNMFGWSVSGAGDVDGDGYDDLVVGAWGDDTNGGDSGSATVISGDTGLPIYTFYGDSFNDHFGLQVSGAGDVDADGYSDVIVGAHADDNEGTNSGSARVFSGQAGNVIGTYNGDDAGDNFGAAVGGGGDTDGDGYADVVVGAYLDDNNGPSSGSGNLVSIGLVALGPSPAPAMEASYGTLPDGSPRTPAVARTFGVACIGSNGNLPHIDFRGAPAIGESFDVTLRAALPNALTFMVLGSPTEVDLGMVFPSMSGCWQYAAVDFAQVLVVTDDYGMGSVDDIQVPNNPGLVGMELNGQFACVDDDANAIGVVTTNGLSLIVGH